MKYLWAVSAAVTLLLSSSAEARNLNLYENIDYNEDVLRKINLDQHSVVTVTTEIKFRSAASSSVYYHVIPRDLDYEHISLKALLPGHLESVKIQRLDNPDASVLRKFTKEQNATDLVFFALELPKSNLNTFTLQEHYKRRKEPFPATIKIQDDQYLVFKDSKYYLSVYPTKS